MRSAARDEYLRKYTGRHNHEKLMSIYDRAIGNAKPADPIPSFTSVLRKVASFLP